MSNITRTFVVGDVMVRALRGVDLTIEAGEFVAIMGSSGSGKSTLMSILGCLDRPTSGHYFFEGIDVAGLAEPDLARIRSERLGFVFQSFNLLARTSAIENVALPLYYAASGPVSRAVRIERARTSLTLLGLGDRERNTPGQLSGGQQQRVAIARALINEPRLLLADEPTGNLDTRTSHEIMDTLVKLNRDKGVTIVVVTHEADVAAYANRDRDHARRRDRLGRAGREAGARAERAGDCPAAPASPPRRSRPPAIPTAGFWTFGLMILAAAAQAIGRNKMRSALTMLGVFIGVAALIVMVAVGDGANEAVRKQIESLGTNLVVIQPGAVRTGGVRAGAGSASTLTVEDARAMPRGFGGRRSGLPASASRGRFSTAARTGRPTSRASAPTIRRSPIGASPPDGPYDEDDGAANLVVVIGQTVYHQLFRAGREPARRLHPGPATCRCR